MTAEDIKQQIRRHPTANERFLLGLLDEARGKVERVKKWRDGNESGGWIERPVEELDAALSDDPEAYLDALGEES